MRNDFLSEVVRCGASQKRSPRDSTKGTARGLLLLAMCRRLRLITRNFYFVADSNRFIITNIKSAESKQRTINTDHTTVRLKPPQRSPPTATRKLPIAVATNQPPIIIPLYFGGATFDTNEIPIGESNNSAKVKMR